MQHVGDGFVNAVKERKLLGDGFVSHGVQSVVLELVKEAEKRKERVMEMKYGDMEAVALFLDSVMDMVTRHGMDLSMPAICLETLMEVATTMDCVEIFDYLDSRMDVYTRQGVRQKSQYTLLRTCNVLLKRLSKSQDAALCGRVLMFLSKFLPLTERSGVNMYGTFHTENVTHLEEVQEGDVDAEGKPIDVEFYKTFWGLQRWFADPLSALSPGAWDTISESLDVVLKKFASEPVTVSETSGGIGSQWDNEGGASVKYLSSARLLSLQIRDATFRRHILIQSLILMGWIENPLLKDWMSKKPGERVLSNIQYMKQKVMNQLQNIPEEGQAFSEAIQRVLEADMIWTVWKQAGCPADPFQVPGKDNIDVDLDLCPPPKRKKMSVDVTFGVELGVPELDRLWNLTEDSLSSMFHLCVCVCVYRNLHLSS